MSVEDVVVVGGGPAGSATALHLARAGFSVTLLDKQEFPRAKPCGDCISPGANVLLQELGVWGDVLAAQPARLEGWLLDCGQARFSSRFDAAAGDVFSLGLPREKLDAILLQHAQRAGVTVRTGARVSELLRRDDKVTGVRYSQDRETRTLEARLVVGADGLRSRVARLLKAYRRAPRVHKVSLTAHVRGVQPARFGEMHVRAGACLGIAPVESSTDPLCNITVVLKRGDYTPGTRHDMMRAALRIFARSDIAELITPDQVLLASGPFDWPVKHVAVPGAALVGDAAGYFDPFTGQGIYHALAGARQLGRSAVRALGGSSSAEITLADYSAMQLAMKHGAHRLQHVVEYVCARPGLTAFAFRAFDKSPHLAATLVAVTADMRPGRDLLSPRSATSLVRATLAAALS